MTVANTDFLTALKNVVIAINGEVQNATNLAGAQDFFNVTGATLVKSSAGRVVNISVVVAGSANGTVYDAVSATDTSRPIYSISHTATGIQVVNLPVQYGLLVVAGSGMTVAGSYS